jgi:hypothetical protein
LNENAPYANISGINLEPLNFGRRLNHHPKNRDHPFPFEKPIPGGSVRHRMDSDHVDQFYSSGCVGYHGCNMLNTRPAWKSRREYNYVIAGRERLATYLDNSDGYRNYSESTKRDPFPWTFPPEDEGSSALGLMKWWKSLGVIKSFTWTFTFDAFLAALQMQPVGVGTMWYDDMMETDERGMLHSELQGSGGGHQYLANAIVWPSRTTLASKRKIGYEQSWGESDEFGFKPTFYMPFEMAEELIIRQEGDVCVPMFL